MSIDDMSKLWSAIQTHYRPSVGLPGVGRADRGHAGPAVSPLPVLSRGTRDPVTHRDRGVVVNPDLLPPLPTLVHGRDRSSPQTGARLGDQVTLSGVRLAGAGHAVRLTHRLFTDAVRAAAHAVDATGASVTIPLPNDAAGAERAGRRPVVGERALHADRRDRSARDQCHSAHPGAGAGDCRRCRARPAGGDRDARRRAAAW